MMTDDGTRRRGKSPTIATIYPISRLLVTQYHIMIEGPRSTKVETTYGYRVNRLEDGYQLEYISVVSNGYRVHHRSRSLFVDEVIEMPKTKRKAVRHGIWI